MISPCQLGCMSRPPLVMSMSAEQKAVLETWIQAHGTPQQVVLRCRIVMGKAAGVGDADLAQQLKINRHTCRLWRRRFVVGGPESLWEVAEGRGRKPQPGLAQKIVEATVKSKPDGQTHWSARTMAKAQGVDPSTVCRIWQETGLQPHRQETFKLSRDPQFVPKLLDVVGVYLHPPQNAWCCAWMKKVRFKRWIEPSQACPSSGGVAAPGPMTTCAMAPPRCSPRSMWRPAKSPGIASRTIATRSFCVSCVSSMPSMPRNRSFI